MSGFFVFVCAMALVTVASMLSWEAGRKPERTKLEAMAHLLAMAAVGVGFFAGSLH